METPPLPNPETQNQVAPANPAPAPPGPAVTKTKRNPWKIFGIIAAVLLVLFIGVAAWWWWTNRMPKPVVLTEPEIEALEGKLTAVSGEQVIIDASHVETPPGLTHTGIDPILRETDPEKRRDMMSAEDRRTIVFSEREVNGFINHNTGLAEKIYLDFENDVIITKFAHTFEDDVPMIGGKLVKLRCRVGAKLDETTGKLFLALQDVTVNGIPIPNAWLGEIKNKNLLDTASDAEPSGFLKAFADGIEDFELLNDELRIRLAP